MSLELRFNSFEDRVRILYERSTPFLNKENAEKGVFEEQLVEGKRLSTSWSPRELTESEKIRMLSPALSIIAAIANFKDHAKAELIKQNKNRKLFEECIDQHRSLGIVVDLNNADKHGTPLKRYFRVSRNPSLKALSRAFRIEPAAGRPDFFTAGQGEASLEGEIQITETESVDLTNCLNEAFNIVEDFILTNLDSKIEPALSRQAYRKKETALKLELNKNYPRALELLRKEDSWIAGSAVNIRHNMLVKPSFERLETDTPFEFGAVLTPAQGQISSYIEVFSLIVGERTRYGLGRGVDIYSPDSKEDFDFVFEHFHKAWFPSKYLV